MGIRRPLANTHILLRAAFPALIWNITRCLFFVIYNPQYPRHGFVLYFFTCYICSVLSLLSAVLFDCLHSLIFAVVQQGLLIIVFLSVFFFIMGVTICPSLYNCLLFASYIMSLSMTSLATASRYGTEPSTERFALTELAFYLAPKSHFDFLYFIIICNELSSR